MMSNNLNKEPLSITHPDLLNDWDYEKNTSLSPDQVTFGSERKVWWLCKLGHSWEASIYHRAKGQGCPICSGNRVLIGFNDLNSVNPQLAKEWNYEKNNPLKPQDVTAGSGKKVWWKCSFGHQWESAIDNRMKGTGCPYCSGTKVLPGFNDLASRYPSLTKEWNYIKNAPLTPESITYGSGKKVWWKCSENHNWYTSVSNRVRGTGCPYCSGRKILPGYNDLATLKPEIAAEWNFDKNGLLLPNNVAVSSNIVVWWKCSSGHEWKTSINDRTSSKNNCPYCSGHRVLTGYNDLSTTHPSIAAEWNFDKNGSLLPTDISFGSNKRVWWKCSKGHEWESTVSNRSTHGCPYCSGRYVISGENDLQTLFPGLIEEWDFNKNYVLPSEIKSGSKQYAWWKCSLGHSYRMSIVTRTSRNGGCPYCSGKKVLPGFNDLASQYPELVEEWNYQKNSPIVPDSVTTKSPKKVWWIGKCGHEWEAVIYSRTNGTGCPFCNKHVFLEGFNDLASQYPDIASEWHPTKNGDFKPNQITYGNSKKIWWLGKCGHEWKSSVKSRVRDSGCPYCSGRSVLKGFNDLESNYPLLSKEWHPTKNNGLLPSQVTTGSGIQVWWKCSKCGHDWKADVVSRKNGRGCPVCSNEKQTSFPEQAVYYYISQKYNALSRYKEGSFEIDVYLPELLTGIEYDGVYYHNSNEAIMRESRKQEYFNNKDIRIIRIKESNENRIEDDVVYYSVNSSYKELPWAILSVLQLLNPSNDCPDIDIARDQGKIYEQYILSEKENSFASVYPELMSEWDYDKNRINPSMVTSTSGKKVWWVCSKCHHEWCASIAHRAYGRGCPECAKVSIGQSSINTRILKNGSLSEVYPVIAQEWHPSLNQDLQPSDVTSNSVKSVWWKCSKCGNEWKSKICTRTRQNSGCPECGKIKSVNSRMINRLSKLGSLSDNYPELSKEWNIAKNRELQPSEVTPYSQYKVWWICSKCGFEWEAKICDRSNGTGCPNCAKHIRVQNRINKKIANGGSLLDYDSKIASEWHPSRNQDLKPSSVTPFSREKVWWICSKGHEWEDVISNRTVRTSGCPYCSNHRVLEGYNDLYTLNPSLASEWNYARNEIKPTEVTPKSGKKVWWKCIKGHEWEAAIWTRSKGRGCPICSNRKLLSGVNDLATTNPQLIGEWDSSKNELSPSEVLPNYDKKVWWKCSSCGYEWETQVRLRVSGSGCPKCAGIISPQVRCIETGVIYSCLKDAASASGVSTNAISNCCRGKSKSSGGYHWEYLE